ncbi:MAG: hypothetical protein NUV80_01035 [Candidatus Berkelbacteria bacterium]|nr:hypothetical protein [Candidatus Berkelbacteria bacterium]
MSEIDKNLEEISNPTAEDLKEEAEATKDKTEQEIRDSVIAEYGLDETVDSDLVSKLTEKELAHRKQLSKTIGQKIKAREALKNFKPKETPAEPAKPASPAEPVDVDTRVNEILNERDLRSLEVSDELKQEIRTYAKAKDISYLEASKSSYITFMKEQEEKKAKIEKASISPKQKANSAAIEFSKDTKSSDFDVTTPEGREAFKKFTAWKASQS